MSSTPLIGEKTYFPSVSNVAFEGTQTDNLLAYRHYNPTEQVGDKTMAEHLRFAIAYWHSFCGAGADPFGRGPRPMPWLTATDPLQQAKDKMDAAFEFITKMGLGYYCFHDFDLIDEADSMAESEQRLQAISDYALQKQQASGVKLLWGTANLFSHPRYMNGASTNPNFHVVARAAAQVKMALDITIKLGGENYVFWGGREGYMSLFNTNMKQELAQMGKFLGAARDYARSQGFTGCFFIEPKPAEPSKHQYDFDAATVIGFLKEHGLENDFKLNLEVNHATLAGHTFEHELQVAADANMLGSIDANRGDYQNGWDTDQFPVDLYELTQSMMIILQAGGFQGGGINFDAKLRRNSTDVEDLFHAHIGGIDMFAKALKTAHNVLTNSPYLQLLEERYASFADTQAQSFLKGEMNLEALASLAQEEPALQSGKQEIFENLLNRYL